MSYTFTCDECYDLFEVEDPEIADEMMRWNALDEPIVCPSCSSFLGNFEFDSEGMVII